jgi:hypothetical protein
MSLGSLREALGGSGGEAAAFAGAAAQKWSTCANLAYTVTDDGRTAQYTNGPTANNVVIETTPCEDGVTDQAVGIAGMIAAKIAK